MFLKALAPDKLYSKLFFFPLNYLKNREGYRKKFTSTTQFLIIYICFRFRDIKVKRMAKIDPLPKFGETFIQLLSLRVARNSGVIATFAENFVQINEFLRNISSDKV